VKVLDAVAVRRGRAVDVGFLGDGPNFVWRESDCRVVFSNPSGCTQFHADHFTGNDDFHAAV